MEKLNFGFQNVIDGNGFTIAITGMLIVFAALAIISLFIASLPGLLKVLSTVLPEEHHHHGEVPAKKPKRDDDAFLAAIGYALYKVRAKNGIKD